MISTTRRPHHADARRERPSNARRRHAASFSDAVIAAYIHDLRRSATPARGATPAVATADAQP